VYAADFFFADVVGYDHNIVNGSMIDNSREIYPQGVIVDYHFDGFDPQYGGLDWRTLRLVLEADNGEWYLSAIINDEWTP
jgi:hypothetical protein